METPQSQTIPLILTEDDFQLFADRYRKPLKKHLNLWELLPKEIEEYILEYNVIPYLHEIKYGVFNLTDHRDDEWANQEGSISREEYHHNRRQEIMNFVATLNSYSPYRIKWFMGWDYDDCPQPIFQNHNSECHLRINKLTIDVYTRYKHNMGNGVGTHFTYVYNRTERKEDIGYYNRNRESENYLYWTNVVNPQNSRAMLVWYCDLNNIRYKPKTGHKFLVKWLKECVE